MWSLAEKSAVPAPAGWREQLRSSAASPCSGSGRHPASPPLLLKRKSVPVAAKSSKSGSATPDNIGIARFEDRPDHRGGWSHGATTDLAKTAVRPDAPGW